MAKKLKIVQFWGPSTVSGISMHIRSLRPVPRPPHALASRSVQMHLLVLGLNQRNGTETDPRCSKRPPRWKALEKCASRFPLPALHQGNYVTHFTDGEVQAGGGG